MQNVQNAAEIQQRVINLVEFYRRKAGWESQTAKDAKADLKFWDQMSYDMLVEEEIVGGLYGEGPHTEVWIKKLMVNEQLLGHFYREVAGEDVNQDILDELLPDVYDKTIFTEEEEAFLKSHFKEMVNYIIITPNDECLELVNRNDSRDAYVIPNEVLELIVNRTNITKGSKILNPYTGFGQFTNLYKGCKFYCDYKNAWMQVSAYANNVDVEYADVEVFEGKGSYDAVVSYLVGLSDKGEDIDYLCKAYESLQPGGQFVLLCPPRLLVEGSNPALRRRLIDDRAIKEIIQLPQVMSNNASFDTYCIIIAEKDRKEQTTAFIDARGVHKDLDNKHYMLSFDIKAFNAIIQNDGIDPRTDRCDVIMLSSSDLNDRILLPQAFLVERPSEKDHPIPLSDVCTLETTSIRNITFDLPMDTPWVKESDLSYLYKGELDVTTLEKAECPNNPPHTEDYAFDDDGKFSDHFFSQRTTIGHRVLRYRACTYVDGKSDVVLYNRTPEDGVCVALIRATGKPIAISKSISTFCLKDGFDALHLLALLRLPIVYRQILAYKDYGLRKFMDMILVPTSKIILNDEIRRMDKEQSILREQGKKFFTMKTEYINEVRMRKHDMGQYIFELVNIEDLMRYYVDNRDKEQNFCQELETLLDNFRTSLGELSTLLADLSKEEQFGEPELFNIDEFLSKMSNRHKADGFKIEYKRDESSIKSYYQKMHRDYITTLDDFIPEENTDSIDDFIPEENTDSIDDFIPEENTDFIDDFIPEENTDSIDDFIPEEDTDSIDDFIPEEDADSNDDFIPEEDTDSIDDFIPEEDADNSDLTEKETVDLPPLYVSPSDINRLVSNIIDNARKHGFTDHNRKDYEVKINMSIDTEKNMFLIDFSNNGNPLPEGMDKMRYGIKGEKAGITGGTGIGGSYVKKFVEHYGGDYDIFMDNGWTVIRIYLPIK